MAREVRDGLFDELGQGLVVAAGRDGGLDPLELAAVGAYALVEVQGCVATATATAIGVGGFIVGVVGVFEDGDGRVVAGGLDGEGDEVARGGDAREGWAAMSEEAGDVSPERLPLLRRAKHQGWLVVCLGGELRVCRGWWCGGDR